MQEQECHHLNILQYRSEWTFGDLEDIKRRGVQLSKETCDFQQVDTYANSLTIGENFLMVEDLVIEGR
ncbi:hypothetical protein KIN20_011219 [Parelaphostrongylus tenuis]|uniref:Uncharacterized protein n=1 Tax=Parelaphostrongylus tenuis TaxID=148309 RepID=A0AAD5MTC6_PARTN|nr:hypothetical protein KIN20_011219 [Parelaphostrongylus tenuis]